ncbi:aminotransferase class I/II-fold pyridoxal phosphate-dependent enzyme [Pseudomonas sp. Fl5BN2]|uniref:aminotransferase-like domain-containing protein n=1 Tax=unclassified Pseudomonas TaxID=196821 RepID=UPI0013775DE0|nr:MULTISPECIES: PLP-dependent aminotransferase family protein [unclassified Pseudomonas]NBF01222.1 aminotransferase class I/II-fold pyridoxal phosphate-dependent enzyme [Pseudomonas sp. Fl5BN2]NBF10033.1 aminotransferase class I/II-fold pyridoxal phosphate-dependent enzyme [Pseudomonas sp. Fl4BN1]
MAVKVSIDMVSMLRSALQDGVGAKYKRLAEALDQAIDQGSLAAGSKLPPHRLLADQLGVTIGTISRAYAELERLGQVVARVGAGTYVRQDGLQRQRDSGFRNVDDEPPAAFDMSRNTHIPGPESHFIAQSLRALAQDPDGLLEISRYSPEAGLARYREAGARWLAQEGLQVDPGQVICVNGAQHGLHIALLALLKAGDTLATEHLTYPGLISTARMLGIKLLGLAMDEQGLLPEALDEACQHHRVSALYCTPTLQNPTTAVQSAARRAAIAEVCRRHNLLILEDETHAVLVDKRPAPLAYFAAERTVLISSLSKAVASGLRVGFVHAPPSLVGRLAAALRATCWMATPLPLELAAGWIDTGVAERLRQQQMAEIARRKDRLTGLLEGLEWRSPNGCPHFWIRVPEPWRASEIEQQLKRQGYLVATAEAFAVGQAAVPQFIRASVCNTTADDRKLIEGFAALAAALSQERGVAGW